MGELIRIDSGSGSPESKPTTLELTHINPSCVHITEDNDHKKVLAKIFGQVGTTESVLLAIQQKQTLLEIPPIIIFDSPFESITKLRDCYKNFREQYPRIDGKSYSEEATVLGDLLKDDKVPLLCYNGNQRLEAFQIGKQPMIPCYLIKSQSDFLQILDKEKRCPNNIENIEPLLVYIDKYYILSYLLMLDDLICIESRRRAMNSIDPNFALQAMKIRREELSKQQTKNPGDNA